MRTFNMVLFGKACLRQRPEIRLEALIMRVCRVARSCQFGFATSAAFARFGFVRLEFRISAIAANWPLLRNASARW
ncbi:hypothetical protein MAXJ12_26623 [Mesorhizobium alhagi CCNWXJ12-2]|uniref:Uncharacterized protein n=1 Tax=Mesorhizobium alhagi CCNWXJ12-2 TaxID=1107882 RepID=H0HYP4_9HYPH|nr:hypothetical protein MAXJ12_26623 [Mesorhizobium alhagi CCNWXJ12-2]